MFYEVARVTWPEPCCFPTSTFWSLRPSYSHVTEMRAMSAAGATSGSVKDGDLFQCFSVDL